MTLVRVLGLLLIVAGVVYAVLYAWWLRRQSSQHQDAAGLEPVTLGTVTDAVTEPAAGHPAKPLVPLLPDEPVLPEEPLPPEEPLNLAWVEGTYLTTTVAVSRQERVVAAGLGTRCQATMVVDDTVVRWERQGASEVRVAGPQVVAVRLGGSTAGRLPRRPQPVLVSWTGDRVHNEDPHKGADRYLTGFQPRSKADSAVLVTAIQQLMQICGPNDSTPTRPDGNP